ncbi:MAG: hypothetical protein ACRCZF_27250, partial [Gemmataceae bacterium]
MAFRLPQRWLRSILPTQKPSSFRPHLVHLEDRVNPALGYVILDSDIAFYGDFTKQSNPSKG